MKIKIVIATLLASATGIYAQDSRPIQLSLTPDVAIFSRTTIVNGVSLNIWGENPQHALTLGIVNGSSGDSAGFSWGIVNYDESYKGVQWGVVNYSRAYFAGWQRGVVNISQGTFIGYESGVVNVSQDTTGFQLGVVNYAEHLQGLQIGLVNIAANNPWFREFPGKLAPVFPLLNWSF